MNYRVVCIILSFLLSNTCFAQVNKNGIPFIRNYTKEEYGASEQNWSVIQDKRGVMYFGNTDDGVLEYDGVNWRKIPVFNSIVRSFAIDDNGKVYVGGLGEFGYLKPDAGGELKYVSLSLDLDSAQKTNADVFKAHFFKGCIYFNSIEKLYKFKEDSLIWIKELGQEMDNFFFSYIVNDHFYINHIKDGLYELVEDSLVLVKGSEFFSKMPVFSMLPFKDKMLVCTFSNGLFLFDPITGGCTELNTQTNNIFVDCQLYDGIQISDEQYALGSFQKGCIILNQDLEIENIINEANGIQNQIITSFYDEYHANVLPLLWTTLSMGISKIDINNPIKGFAKESDLTAGINDVIRFDDRIYIATDIGVFYLDYVNGFPKFVQIKDFDHQSWSFKKFKSFNGKENLIVATQGGVYIIRDTQDFTRIDGKGYLFLARCILNSKLNPATFFIGHSEGLAVYTYENNMWQVKWVAPFNYSIEDILEDPNGEIWLSSDVDGIFKLSKSEQDYTISRYGQEKGVPIKEDPKLFYYKNNIVARTNLGFLKYDIASDSFLHYDVFGDIYNKELTKIYKHTSYDEKYLFSFEKDNRWYVRLEDVSDSVDYEWLNIFFKILPNNQAEAFYFDKDSLIWIGLSDELYCFDIKAAYRQCKGGKNNVLDSVRFNCLVRKVIVDEDSVLFNGTNYKKDENGNISKISLTQPEELIFTLPYKYNSITFEFAAPFFTQEEKTQYSHKLEGFDKEWSKWSRETKAPYTNLNEGTYVFQVKAKNVYEVESTIGTYEFTILPPWYRTILAYIIYVIIGIFLVVVIVKYYTRRLKRENERLETIVAERTAEVVKQKDEIECQRDKIAAQNKDIKDSIHYASRIQQALLPSEKVYTEDFFDHFVLFRPRDIVSGDFYWISQEHGKLYIVAADCTGHGVPGAFMSMLGISFLNEIVSRTGTLKPAEILNQLRAHVVDALKQEGKIGEQKDGMDLALIVIDKTNKKLEYAGANNPLYWVRPLTEEEKMNRPEELPRELVWSETHQLKQISADKMPIGISSSIDISFSSIEIDIEVGHSFYIFSDGYVDQFGGEKGKKFMSKAFKEYILKIQNFPMEEQRKMLNDNIEEWMTIGQYGQVDDQLVIGVKIDKLS
ncbi:MAG: SpoIIE family protein phosphatase [Bacteroidales bacterium]|nr:SpoIIE family protein phosphatase [Bacteroidales bacterium]